jgi:hypothetical protein
MRRLLLQALLRLRLWRLRLGLRRLRYLLDMDPNLGLGLQLLV